MHGAMVECAATDLDVLFVGTLTRGWCPADGTLGGSLCTWKAAPVSGVRPPPGDVLALHYLPDSGGQVSARSHEDDVRISFVSLENLLVQEERCMTLSEGGGGFLRTRIPAIECLVDLLILSGWSPRRLKGGKGHLTARMGTRSRVAVSVIIVISAATRYPKHPQWPPSGDFGLKSKI